jgi:hypothetical protein
VPVTFLALLADFFGGRSPLALVILPANVLFTGSLPFAVFRGRPLVGFAPSPFGFTGTTEGSFCAIATGSVVPFFAFPCDFFGTSWSSVFETAVFFVVRFLGCFAVLGSLSLATGVGKNRERV